MLQIIFKSANRRGFTVREYDLEALAENAQYDLFHNSCSTDHCLNHLYTANGKKQCQDSSNLAPLYSDSVAVVCQSRY